MTPIAVLGLALLAVVVSVAFALAMTPRKRRNDDPYKSIADSIKAADYGRDDGQADVQQPRSNISFEKIKSTMDPKPAPFGKRDLDEPFRRAAENVKAHPPVEAKYHPRPIEHIDRNIERVKQNRKDAKEYGIQNKPTIFLSPRQVERINTQRRLRGKQPFSRKGLENAVAHPWDRWDVRQPQSSTDWISYLIAYEIFFADHQSPYSGGCGGLTIDPNLPYNGQGGDFAGAGASGDWSNNNLNRAEAAAIEHGVPILGSPDDSVAAIVQPSSYSAAPVSGASIDNPGPSGDAPSYSAPDTSSSSSSYDSGSSSSSSSYDSGSSSSDSGSSGGGGGD